MWGFGGRFYRAKKTQTESESKKGIVVVFAWMSSQNKHLKNYVHLYSSLGFDSLICHSQFLNMYMSSLTLFITLLLLCLFVTL